MTNQMKQFFKSAIQCIQKYGVDEPVKVISPLIQNINHTQYNKLSGHINTCSSFRLSYFNKSNGYNDGCLMVHFEFPNSKTKMYQFDFSSKLNGDYGKDEWWCPMISCSVTEDVDNTVAWNGSENDFLQFEKELMKELNNEEEINKLKQDIAEKQRQLAKLAVKAS